MERRNKNILENSFLLPFLVASKTKSERNGVF